MPIFEYTCNACGRNFSALVGVVATATLPSCPKCQGVDLKKRVSRFARVRNTDEALDDLADRADRMDPENPHHVRGLMRDMAGEMGEDFDDGELDAMMEAMHDEDAAESGATDTMEDV